MRETMLRPNIAVGKMYLHSLFNVLDPEYKTKAIWPCMIDYRYTY